MVQRSMEVQCEDGKLMEGQKGQTVDPSLLFENVKHHCNKWEFIARGCRGEEDSREWRVSILCDMASLEESGLHGMGQFMGRQDMRRGLCAAVVL